MTAELEALSSKGAAARNRSRRHGSAAHRTLARKGTYFSFRSSPTVCDSVSAGDCVAHLRGAMGTFETGSPAGGPRKAPLPSMTASASEEEMHHMNNAPQSSVIDDLFQDPSIQYLWEAGSVSRSLLDIGVFAYRLLVWCRCA